MTKTVRFAVEGGPEVLELVDVELGDPGAGELRLRVEAIGLNRAEAMFRSGTYFERPDAFPAKLGYSASGIVEAVGEGVTGFAAGDAVSTVAGFSMRDYGVYGEAAIVPASAVLRRPEGLDATEAVALWGPFLTAYGAIVEEGKVRPGDHVLITAASSSVGLATIDVVNHIGAIPIAATRTAAKKQRLLDAGAAHVIVTGDEDITGRTLEITGQRGAEFVFDAVAGDGVRKLAAATAKGGTLVVYGALDTKETPFPLWFVPTMRLFNAFDLTLDPERLARAGHFVRAGVRAGTFRPRVDRVFDLDDVAAAHRYLEANGQFGKVVVGVGG
ncbi:zinc-dependent alcohol dehydrogenase family protein [Amycolatopsis sp. SID8362]|uniref:zinc-dependent alcohol dehydrogenase family protein n=1 Tax=Amycolatopsis sp. SID8362 TaxID=2690346 RepID=UPI00136B412D|nr:zinc-dependent alcohol dehydrogenase family protein [Amycolatopsis sp. SID8362]NBH09243.1 zinc-binding dehydrogenase [Amycolatopsis sp. SID8362]NED45936.1 zinc-dependent alcohol dehydrogenase family protein [Amycolatopsis sp. SID8362]